MALLDFLKPGCPQWKMIQLGTITANRWTGGDGPGGIKGPGCHCKADVIAFKGNQGRSLVIQKRQTPLTILFKTGEKEATSLTLIPGKIMG